MANAISWIEVISSGPMPWGPMNSRYWGFACTKLEAPLILDCRVKFLFIAFKQFLGLMFNRIANRIFHRNTRKECAKGLKSGSPKGRRLQGAPRCGGNYKVKSGP